MSRRAKPQAAGRPCASPPAHCLRIIPRMPTADLLVSELRKVYPTPTQPLVVLRGVNLKLSPGERLAVVGPSGSGKSTLLNILGTLDSPSGGSVLLGGVDPFSLDGKELARFRSQSIGFIFQD